MAKETTSERITPPYIPWETFTSFLARLKNTVVPNRIDSSMMPVTMSGTVRVQLASALRFLGLVTEEGTVTEKLKKLVKIFDTEEWTGEGLQILMDPFDQVINGLELESATAGELDERFEQFGLTGQMRDKCIRFYLAAMTSIGAHLSPHLLQRRKRAKPPTRQRRRTGKDIEKGETNNDEVDRSLPSGMVAIPLYPFPRQVLVPRDITELECDAIDAMIRAYAKSVTQSKKGENPARRPTAK